MKSFLRQISPAQQVISPALETGIVKWKLRNRHFSKSAKPKAQNQKRKCKAQAQSASAKRKRKAQVSIE